MQLLENKVVRGTFVAKSKKITQVVNEEFHNFHQTSEIQYSIPGNLNFRFRADLCGHLFSFCYRSVYRNIR
jgi:hypothetical protein